jgi:SAM-dependent methyltransferase
VRDADGRFHRLQHGTTLHGAQAREPARRTEPQTYYHRTGPIGQLIAGLPERRRLARTAVVGLGVGTMACHARAGETWTFYEIDPSVERVARDSRLFTYLRDCPGRHRVVVGDGRARLREAPDGAYGLVVLDAFNSDAIPVHLLTREALALDVRKLAPGGVLAVHLSNRWADLEPVVGAVARSAGLVCREQTDLLVEGDMVGKSPSHWAVLARRPADLGRAGTSARWGPCDAARTPWTDGRSDVLGVLDL